MKCSLYIPKSTRFLHGQNLKILICIFYIVLPIKGHHSKKITLLLTLINEYLAILQRSVSFVGFVLLVKYVTMKLAVCAVSAPEKLRLLKAG